MSVPGGHVNFSSESSAPEEYSMSILPVVVVIVATFIFVGPPFRIIRDLAILCLLHLVESSVNAMFVSSAGLPKFETGDDQMEGDGTGPQEVCPQPEIISSSHQAESPASNSSAKFESPRHDGQSSTPVLDEISLSQLSKVLNLAIASFSVDYASRTSISVSSAAKLRVVTRRAATSKEAAMICFNIALRRLMRITWRKVQMNSALDALIADNERLRAQNAEAEGKIARLEQTLSDTIRKAEAAVSMERKERLNLLERRMELFEWATSNLDPITKKAYIDALVAESPTNLGNAGKGEREVAKFGRLPPSVLANSTNIQ